MSADQRTLFAIAAFGLRKHYLGWISSRDSFTRKKGRCLCGDKDDEKKSKFILRLSVPKPIDGVRNLAKNGPIKQQKSIKILQEIVKFLLIDL